MKKLFFAAALLLLGGATAQEVREPEFIGEAIAYNKETGESVNLANETPATKTAANAAMYLTGLGSIKTKWVLEGSHSVASITTGKELYIVIRGESNSQSPASYIRIFKLKRQGKKRVSEVSKIGSFSGVSDNNQDYIMFQATKFGESSYLIKLSDLYPGEYGVKIATETGMISTLSVTSSTQSTQAVVERMIELNQSFGGNGICFDPKSEKYISQSDFIDRYGESFYYELETAYAQAIAKISAEQKAAREKVKQEKRAQKRATRQ